MRFKSLWLVFALAGAACAPSTNNQPEGTPEEATEGEASSETEESPEPDSIPLPEPSGEMPRSCSVDDDCVLIETSCCACDAGDYEPIQREARSEWSDQLRPDCSDQECPAQDCVYIRPFCVSGTCVVGEDGYRPAGMMGGYFMSDDAPHPTECTADTDCSANTTLNETGCCRDHQVRPQSSRYASWSNARPSSEACAAVECPPPPPPAEPAECHFALTCAEGHCQDSCP